MEVDELYDKELSCPICELKFNTKKMRRSAVRIEKTDSDFCCHYKSSNPYFYALSVCPQCGYIEFENIFGDISKVYIESIVKNITLKWTPRDYGNERDLAQAIEIYKLALYQSEIIKRKYSYKANLCLKLAWFYRYEGDAENETKYIEFASHLYGAAYTGEEFPITGMDSAKLAYLVGELSRRLGRYVEAIKWFGKAVEDPNIKKSIQIKRMAREKWRSAAEAYKELKVKSNQEL